MVGLQDEAALLEDALHKEAKAREASVAQAGALPDLERTEKSR